MDGFNPENVGGLVTGERVLEPCTPAGCVKMLEMCGLGIEGKHAVIVGRSNIVGKPVAMMLLARGATVSICHSKTRDLGAMTRQGDILVAAVGVPQADQGLDGQARRDRARCRDQPHERWQAVRGCRF